MLAPKFINLPFDLTTISLFKYLNQKSIDLIVEEVFDFKKVDKGESIVEYNKPMDGFYLIVGGNVDIYGISSERPFGKASQKETFGLLCLIGDYRPPYTAKANDQVLLLFASKKTLGELLARNDDISFQLHRGMTEILGTRLMRLNELQFSTGDNKDVKVNMIDTLREQIDDHASIRKIRNAQNSLDEVGLNIIDELWDSYNLLEELGKANPDFKNQINNIVEKIKKVAMQDAQIFDRVCQQIDLFHQIINNFYRIIEGLDPEPIAGDKNLFK
ncbi:MAG: cyclic nucleotide-binding domain-containing protein [Oligoflexales bacterium]